jgi:hypothetical protein
MTAFYAIPVLFDGQIRLRVYAGGDLKIEVPLRPRQALALAGLLLNYALMVRESADRQVFKASGENVVTRGIEAHSADIGAPGVFHLSLKPAPDIDPDRALKGALKVLWRGFGLKCTSIRENSQ